MIARRKALHMAAAVALTAYIFCTVLIRTFGDKAWSVSLPKLDLSRNYMADSVFEHIQNNTLGVRPCPLTDRLGLLTGNKMLV